MAGRLAPSISSLLVAVVAALLACAAPAGAQDYEFVRAFGGSGAEPGEFSFPLGVTVARDGTVYVADTFNHRIQRFDRDGNALGVIGAAGEEAGELDEPFDVEFDADGTLLVAEAGNARIQRFDPADGASLGMIGRSGTGPGELASPTGLAPDGDGGVFVVDSANEQVVHYDAGGELLASWGQSGSEPGSFSLPFDVAVGPEGVYVADTANDRVQRFGQDGSFRSEWGGLSIPQGLDVGAGGRVFVADSGRDQVRLFDPFGNPLAAFGVSGAEQGQFDLPRGIAVGCDGLVYVTDVFNNRVQVFVDPDAAPAPGACGLTLEELIERARALVIPRWWRAGVVIRLRFAGWMLSRDRLTLACHTLDGAARKLERIGRTRHGSPEVEGLRTDIGLFAGQVGCPRR